MAKYFGKIGFVHMTETSRGIWEEQVTEREYMGDVGRMNFRNQPSDQLNDDINIANEFSIVADLYAEKNFHAMRYIEFMGAKWKINSVEVKRPRLILTTGGVYNGEQA